MRAQETEEQRAERMVRQRIYTQRYLSTEHGRRMNAAKRNRNQKHVAEMSEDERNHRRARVAISQARTHGIRVPVTCEQCGERPADHAHHWHGYEPEHWLDVIWLCIPCHEEEHYGDKP